MSSPQERPDPAAPVTVTFNAPLRVDGKALARSVQEHTSRHSRRERSTTDLTEQVQAGVVPSEDDPPEPPAELPAEFAGCIGIEWPAAALSPGHAIPAWRIAFYDDDGYVTTIFRMDLHAEVTGITWADLTVFATPDGKPLLHLPEGAAPGSAVLPLGDDGEPITGTFRFLVTSMRVKGGTA